MNLRKDHKRILKKNFVVVDCSPTYARTKKPKNSNDVKREERIAKGAGRFTDPSLSQSFLVADMRCQRHHVDQVLDVDLERSRRSNVLEQEQRERIANTNVRRTGWMGTLSERSTQTRDKIDRLAFEDCVPGRKQRKVEKKERGP